MANINKIERKDMLMPSLAAKYQNDTGGTTFIEFALIFPVIFMLMLGVWDLGHGFWAGQKLITASQTIADLVSRELTITEGEVGQALLAGGIAMQPFDSTKMKVEIISVSYDEDGNIDDNPKNFWQWSTETGQDGDVGEDLYAKMEDISLAYDGMVGVRVSYTHKPLFGTFIYEDFKMEEISFARGRKSPIVRAVWKQD